MRATALITIPLLALAACVAGEPFHCAIDGDCASGDERGTCESTGYCSFDDSSCDSGRRYGALAGELGDSCVVQETIGGDLPTVVGPAAAVDDGEQITPPGCQGDECQCATAIATGSEHTCAVRGDGTVWCWGNNASGALGDGTTSPRLQPVQVSGLPKVDQLAAGEYHTCALARNGNVWCWGNNAYGSIGDGTKIDRYSPVRVPGLTNVVAIDVGEYHGCAVDDARQLHCWGRNQRGQLGLGDTADRVDAIAVGLGDIVRFATEGHHACALLDDDTIRCWGKNLFGQLGDGTTTDRRVPTEITAVGGVEGFGLGGEHTCFYDEDGNAECTGRNSSGELGDGTTTDRTQPVQVQSLGGIEQVAAGEWHTCARTDTGAVYCWGLNLNGALGDGTTADRTSPGSPVADLAPVIAIASGERHSCGLTAGGEVLCWGYNASGQLGDGSLADRTRAVSVDLPCPE